MRNNLFFNLGASILTFLMSAFITFWMTPLILDTLGKEAFGFIPLTQQIISILSVLTFALSSVIARFLTVSISQRDLIKAEEYFNTYLVATIVGSAILMSIILVLIPNIDSLINVPSNLAADVKLGIFFSGILVIITFLHSLFLAGPFVLNKLYVNKAIEAMGATIKAAATLILLTVLSPKIWYVNLGAFIAGVASLLVSIVLFRKLMPLIKLNFKKFSFLRLKELLSAGVWNSIGQVGVILFLSVEILLANILFGAKMAGVYGALLQLPLLLRTVANITSSVFAPIIIRKYAENDIKGLVSYSKQSVKINGLLIALPAALICGFSERILSIWLGADFVSYKWILILNSAYLIITLSLLPLTHIFTAMNKLKLPGLTTIALGLFNLILAVILALNSELGIYSIILAGAISLLLKNVVFISLYSARLTNHPPYFFFISILYPLIGGLFIILISYLIQTYFYVSSIYDLIFSCLMVTIAYTLFSYTFFLNSHERQIIRLIRK